MNRLADLTQLLAVLALANVLGACKDGEGSTASDASTDGEVAATATANKLCQNASDGPKVAKDSVFLPAYSACISECGAAGAPASSCITACLSTKIGLSTPCADCWGDYAHCNAVACPACSDPEATTCRDCQDSSDAARACFHVMSDCTGFTF